MHRPRSGAVLVLGLLIVAIALPAQQPAPQVLRDQVPSRGLAQGRPFDLGGRACLAADRGALPNLIWDRTDRLPVPDDRGGAAAWLAKHGAALGHGAFTPVFARATAWGTATVLVFTLEHGGLPLVDAEVWVCFDDGGCVGLVNRVPAGLDRPPAAAAGLAEPCYKVRRAPAAPDRLVVAERRRTQTPTHDVLEFVEGGTAFARELTQRTGAAPDNPATFTTFSFGGFPDQLQADARGVIWCSDPTLGRLLEIDPQTGAAVVHPASPATSQPDGLCVDPNGRVWTGLYTSGMGLGRFDRATGVFTRFPPTSPTATLAIPTWHPSGSIFVTQHSPALLHEFDYTTSTWRQALAMPGFWPVCAIHDATSGDLFVLQYSSNSVARIRNSAVADNYPTPVLAGPSFGAAHNGKIWFSYWSTTQIGELDVATGAFTTHNMTVSGAGGPIDVGPNGHVYLGTRSTGYIIEFDPVTATSTNHAIPSGGWSLKDGLTVAPDGTVWFTSSSSGRVVRMTLP